MHKSFYVNFWLTKRHQISASDTSRHELTDSMILSLSEKINKEGDLRKLAILGLAVSDDVISGSLYRNQNDINGAAYDVLKTWRLQYQVGTEARDKLREALKSVNMSYCLQALQWTDHIHLKNAMNFFFQNE